MKKKYAALALLLCLTLAACGPRRTQDEPTPTPEPSPSATPEAGPSAAPLPDGPEADPKGYLLSYVDQALEGETASILFWQHPGSGPSGVELSVAEHGQDIRALFAALDWEITEAPVYTDDELDAYYDQPAYNVTMPVYRGGEWIGELSLRSGEPLVTLRTAEPAPVYLRADGSEKLCDQLADLTPSAYIQLGRTRVPPQGSQEATLKLYLETALELLKANGHITDYTLDHYEVIPPDPGEPTAPLEYPRIAYAVTYSLKPTHPELRAWEGLEEKDDGWLEETIDWEHISYDDRDRLYGMD